MNLVAAEKHLRSQQRAVGRAQDQDVVRGHEGVLGVEGTMIRSGWSVN